MAEVAGQTVVDGRYRITSRIGSGGMADVYCADDTHLGREVALKILHRRFAQDDEFVERFRREASAAAGLQHPNVVSVYDRGSHDDTWYIAMEHLKGRTLKQLIADDAPVDQRRAIDLTIQILQAASFAHKRGVIHRDFKPHNVIVAADDSAKVTDFGIARAGASEMTETGSIMGTAQYLSPEQAQGHRVDARSDLYSIGVILFELLTGGVPFSGESAVSIALKHVSQPAPAVSQLRPDVYPVLEAVVGRALVKDPDGRFQSAEEFVLALDDAGREIAAGRGGGDSTGRFAPIGPPPVPPVLEWDEEGGGERRRRARWPWIALVLLLVGLGVFLYFALAMKTEQVKVPNVATLTVDRATAKLQRFGFDVKTRSVRNQAEPGIVLGSDPKARAKVNKGSTVTLIVSSGPGVVSVPTVDGFSQSRAQRTLAKAGFVFQVREKPNATVPAGMVIRTNPTGGTNAPYRSTVVVYVSTGPKQVLVPNVLGQTQSSAEKQLEAKGFQVVVEQQESDQPEGKVLKQIPVGAAQVDQGSVVTITVAKPKPKVTVPDVTNQDEAAARHALEGLKLKVKVKHQDVTDPLQDGLVIDQNPKSGNEVTEGDTVTIVIGRLPPAPPPPTTPGGTSP